MMTWSTKRKRFYLSIFLFILIGLVGVPLFIKFYNPPTCFDNKMNGKETGIDCGGSCAKICNSDYLTPFIEWTRFQKISSGVYNVAAMIKNPNISGGVKEAKYILKLYDSNGVLILEKNGVTSIPAKTNILVFQPSLKTNERVPARATFEFSAPLSWVKHDTNYQNISILKKDLTNDTKAPKLTATLKNISPYPILLDSVGAVLFDSKENVVAFSKTVLEKINPNSEEDIVFTWPIPFDREVVRVELYPILPF